MKKLGLVMLFCGHSRQVFNPVSKINKKEKVYCGTCETEIGVSHLLGEN